MQISPDLFLIVILTRLGGKFSATEEELLKAQTYEGLFGVNWDERKGKFTIKLVNKEDIQ